MLDDTTVAAYLDRISARRPAKADLESLRNVQMRHLLSVPFENLGYHLGEEIHMDERAVDKVVQERRGGGCYEVNPSLKFLLESLGYEVSLLPGRVWIKGRLTAPLCHLALKVRAEGAEWLVDVGFGRNSRYPLSLATRDEQQDPHGSFRVAAADDGGIDVSLNGTPQYRVYDIPCDIFDFGPTLWWYRTAPDSPFLQNLFCSLPTENGRVTLKEDQLTLIVGTERESRRLSGEEEIREAYDKWFGIRLERLPVKASQDNGISMSFD
ncbi:MULTISPECIES: arylamine N-acetyltransferase [Streptomyces]|uniref:N-acetyltransferase n=1 Tax=Streptomyces albus subsp. chlorinus TaxID=337066 RepID=A0A3G4YJK0_9ACTN|nr:MULTISPECIES: arylamine N-acetyltransferase [Streptomyces]UZN59885.1 N-acetyltransferase [Streptomyces albus subsp. chlorinus] [Streptomyces sp. GBA 94-10 4N24]WAE19998.1 N-acetyltransferase [Streptomyces albus subsp. chlorinus] [Streptomyces albidoflavus]AYV61412.1 N-acetyltransferase [Streptomyces albus subsp. chlorinus]NSC25060.1 arylamine N-acetyltransferase [Streptomyces albus subsp. chlorinus]UZN60205.1 N-acetyltransferase [Streptomyces albus subsp. chlorinus] [Streptomyces sp. GBA 94